MPSDLRHVLQESQPVLTQVVQHRDATSSSIPTFLPAGRAARVLRGAVADEPDTCGRPHRLHNPVDDTTDSRPAVHEGVKQYSTRGLADATHDGRSTCALGAPLLASLAEGGLPDKGQLPSDLPEVAEPLPSRTSQRRPAPWYHEWPIFFPASSSAMRHRGPPTSSPILAAQIALLHALAMVWGRRRAGRSTRTGISLGGAARADPLRLLGRSDLPEFRCVRRAGTGLHIAVGACGAGRGHATLARYLRGDQGGHCRYARNRVSGAVRTTRTAHDRRSRLRYGRPRNGRCRGGSDRSGRDPGGPRTHR